MCCVILAEFNELNIVHIEPVFIDQFLEQRSILVELEGSFYLICILFVFINLLRVNFKFLHVSFSEVLLEVLCRNGWVHIARVLREKLSL